MNKKLIYASVGVLALLIVYSSTRKVELTEVTYPSITAKSNFDSSSLPPSLRPPIRLSDSEPIPIPAKKGFSLNSIGLKPRFDTA